ncbi:MAG: amino acid adenylation domain-containing protein, partial [Candidatus Aminicenantes bacterium]|nr:amino acid adenylation domain-containing protein [Candidatus Aminicenantes bacterium]
MLNQFEERKKRKVLEEYWLKKLAGDLPEVRLPRFTPFKEAVPGKETFSMDLPAPAAAQLKKVSKGADTALYILFLAALNIVIYKYSGNEDLVIGTLPPGLEKQNEEILFCRTFLHHHLTMRDYINRVRQAIPEAFVHSGYPFGEIVRKLGVRNPTFRHHLFSIAFIYDKLQNRNDLLEQFNLIFVLAETGNRLILEVEYPPSLYLQETIRRFCRSVMKVIDFIPGKLDSEIGRLDILSSREKEQLLVDFNRTETGYPRDKTLTRLFEEQVEKTPDHTVAVAFIEPVKGSERSGCTLSYRELNRMSDRLVPLLLEKGVRQDTVVGIMAERSIEMLIGILGILKAGGAYLPIDPGYPEQRKAYMLRDSSAKVLLTTKGCNNDAETFKSQQVERIFIEKITSGRVGSRKVMPPDQAFPYNLAYIIYTSGSTGQPKGIMVDHFNVVRLVKNTNYVTFRPGDRVLPTGALEFDASTFEIWGGLLNGLRLCLVSEDVILSPNRLKEAILKNKITTMWLTSPLFNQLMQEDIGIFCSLRNLLVGGDALSPPHINRLREKYSTLDIINGYGPTENTTFSTTYLITGIYSTNIPIGKPIANSTAYIVDRFAHLQPVGVPGELLVGGAGVARGYLNNPELTSEKFIPAARGAVGGPSGHLSRTLHHMLSGLTKTFDNKLYKTGDLARWLTDGNIEFLGRMDQQVKIRGFRIELGEIEARLLERPEVKEAVVTVWEEEKGEKALCAYIVARLGEQSAERETQESEPGQTCDTAGIKAFLAAELPGYMVPSYFVLLDKIPLTANGKVNRKALPEPEVVSEAVYAAPRDEIEERLAGIWQQVLQTQSAPGLDDNFFDLGGHSLKGTVLISKIHKEFNVRLSLAEIFNYPTIRKLSRPVKQSVEDTYQPIKPAKQKDYYTQSSAQKRLYILHQVEHESMSYNMPMVYELERETDTSGLPEIFRGMIARHESFRTSFHLVEREPVQKIHESGEIQFEIEYFEAVKRQKAEGNCIEARRGMPETSRRGLIHQTQNAVPEEQETGIIDRFIRPFDLSKSPLLRVGLVNRDAGKSLLLI